MKKIFLLGFFLPVFAAAQVKKPVARNKKPVKAAAVKPAADGFVIDGEIKGYNDGTNVSLLNGQTGAPEAETTVKQNKFSFKGKMDVPDFKIILFNKQQPFITLFLDNSPVKISADKDALNNAVITGSASHNDFTVFNNSIAPYQNLFAENGARDEATVEKVKSLLSDFVKSKPASFISPLAAIRYSQVSENPADAEFLYNMLDAPVKNSSMAAYLQQQIAEAKRNAIGSIMPDFAQDDTTGKPVSLSSLRGKYVLIDFWASWCRPCRMENPNVVASFKKYKEKNFTVFGVSLDKSKPAWIEAINMDGLTWPHVSDLQGWANSVAKQFGIQSIPQNFLIGPDGKIIAKNLRGPALERKLEQLLK